MNLTFHEKNQLSFGKRNYEINVGINLINDNLDFPVFYVILSCTL